MSKIDWAEKNMGDYKLKSADDYVVPAHKLENVEHKRRQMALIEQAIYQVKMSPLSLSLLCLPISTNTLSSSSHQPG